MGTEGSLQDQSLHILFLKNVFWDMRVYYCDMKPESRKCGVREAQQRRRLLDNG